MFFLFHRFSSLKERGDPHNPLTILCIRMQVRVKRTHTIMIKLCLNGSLLILRDHDILLAFLFLFLFSYAFRLFFPLLVISIVILLYAFISPVSYKERVQKKG